MQPCAGWLSAEVQHWQASLLQLQDEAERQRALQEQSLLEKDSQLAGARAELLSQTQQLDSCQARVSSHPHQHLQASHNGESFGPTVPSVGQISYLEVEVETLAEQLQSPEPCTDSENGTVTVDDLDHLQKVNRDLEQQLSDKNRVRSLHLPLLLIRSFNGLLCAG